MEAPLTVELSQRPKENVRVDPGKTGRPLQKGSFVLVRLGLSVSVKIAERADRILLQHNLLVAPPASFRGMANRPMRRW